MIPSYTIQYSYRKTISIRINKKGELIVGAPFGVPEYKIKEFVNSKSQWIEEKIKIVKLYISDNNAIVTKTMKDKILIQILPRIEYYIDLMKLKNTYTSIKITNSNYKWGSCSSTGGLMFHRKLSQFPISIVDYVIVHELAHLVHFNHSKDFWNLVESYYPEYKTAKKWLKDHSQGKTIG